MKITTFQTGYLEVNTSILVDGDKAIAIDPGANAERIAEEVSRQNASLKEIWLTHAHFDHIGAIPELLKRFPDAVVYMHPGDKPLLGDGRNRFEPEYPFIERLEKVADCRELSAAKIIETPGHSPGGVCYYLESEKVLFSGDTLFFESYGRTDFPGGDFHLLQESFRKLAELPDDTKVIPGHGPATTIGHEKANNPMFLSHN